MFADWYGIQQKRSCLNQEYWEKIVCLMEMNEWKSCYNNWNPIRTRISGFGWKRRVISADKFINV